MTTPPQTDEVAEALDALLIELRKGPNTTYVDFEQLHALYKEHADEVCEKIRQLFSALTQKDDVAKRGKQKSIECPNCQCEIITD